LNERDAKNTLYNIAYRHLGKFGKVCTMLRACQPDKKFPGSFTTFFGIAEKYSGNNDGYQELKNPESGSSKKA